MTMLGKMFADDSMLAYGAIVLGVTLVLGVLLLLRAERRKMRRPSGRRILSFDADGNRVMEFILRERSGD